jgi:hypothetical protein
VLTSYTWHPFITVEAMLDRTAGLFGPAGAGGLMDVTGDILRAAARRVPHQDIFFMEAAEQGNPRRSFDINMYRAKLRMEELEPILSRLLHYYDLPVDRFRALCDDIRASVFGHISGGIGRTGNDFFTVYHRETYGWDGAPIHDAVTRNGDAASADPATIAVNAPNARAITATATATKRANTTGGNQTTRASTPAASCAPRSRAAPPAVKSYKGGQGQNAPPSPRSGSNSRTCGKCNAENDMRFHW